MPPKRRGPPSKATSSHPTPRRSALAKAHAISASTEAEIREAFLLFSTAASSSSSQPQDALPTPSLRRALTALGVPPDSASELASLREAADPDESGVVEYETFVAVAALKLNARGEESRREEVDGAFALFVGGRGELAGERRIMMGDLRRVARELKEEVGEGVLRDMILEANGGEGVGRGVGVGEFEGVMRRAGVFG